MYQTLIKVKIGLALPKGCHARCVCQIPNSRKCQFVELMVKLMKADVCSIQLTVTF